MLTDKISQEIFNKLVLSLMLYKSYIVENDLKVIKENISLLR